MLFDLRSRGRRRTVQAIYLFLAILLGGGLILFGVGTGSGGGGLFGAFLGNGSGNSQSSVVSSQVKTAQRQTQQNPSSAAAWSALLSAQVQSARDASPGSASSPPTWSAAGLKDLAAAAQAWERYLSLTKSPDPGIATLAARGYQALGQYANAARAWQVVTSADPTEAEAFVCVAANSYAAKQTRVGELATTKALSLAPKADRAQLKSDITSAQTQPSVVPSIC
ncbi:MAG: hypothetical protein WAK93_02285 [Solirubrobacteraceae bacterium]